MTRAATAMKPSGRVHINPAQHNPICTQLRGVSAKSRYTPQPTNSNMKPVSMPLTENDTDFASNAKKMANPYLRSGWQLVSS